MRSALDEAFLRRLRFVITFPFPGRAQRRAIWQRAWPPETPLADLDHDRLARLSLTGGNITNVALNAAFTAAERGSAVTMPLVLGAAALSTRSSNARSTTPTSGGASHRNQNGPAVGQFPDPR